MLDIAMLAFSLVRYPNQQFQKTIVTLNSE